MDGLSQIAYLLIAAAVLAAVVAYLWTRPPFSLRGAALVITCGMLAVILIVIFQVYWYR
jgi:membrane protein YdbS with pleckstrin-like domain